MLSTTGTAVRITTARTGCPVWCLEDHTCDPRGEHFHRSQPTLVPGGLNDGAVQVALEQLTADGTDFDGEAVIHVNADAYMTPDRARALAAVLLVAAATAADRG